MNIFKTFVSLGFDSEEALILSFLTRYDKQSVLQISRGTGIERTKIYRIIDNLLREGYVVQSKGVKKHVYSIGSVLKFSERKDSEIRKLQSLKDGWMEFLGFINKRGVNSGTDVRFYRGKDGIKQVLWNELSAKEILSFTYRNLQDVVGDRWFKKLAVETDRRGIIVKDLRTLQYKVFDEKLNRPRILFKGDEIRYLPPEFEDFYLAVDVYNDVVALYDWRNDEVFAVEIQNENFAKFFRMIFYRFWNQAKPA